MGHSPRTLLNTLTPLVLIVGIASVIVRNLRLWQADRKRAIEQSVPAPVPILNRQPKVSILVAAWNEGPNLDAHIQSVLSLAYPDKEFVICAGGGDGTFARAQAYEGTHEQVIVLEQQPGEGKQCALQRCFEASHGEIIYLTDADCLIDDTAFEATLAPLVNDGKRVATGGSHPLGSQQDNPFVVQQWFADIYSQAAWGETTTGLLGRNCAITRQTLIEIGAFTADVRTGTDYHMAKEMVAHGMEIMVARHSSVATHFADTLSDYRRQQARWLRNVVIHGTTYGATREVVSNAAPSVIGLVMLALPLMSLIVGPIALALWVIAFAQALASRVRYVKFGEVTTNRQFRAFRLIPAYVIVDFTVWAAVLPEYLLGRLRNRW